MPLVGKPPTLAANRYDLAGPVPAGHGGEGVHESVLTDQAAAVGGEPADVLVGEGAAVGDEVGVFGVAAGAAADADRARAEGGKRFKGGSAGPRAGR